MTLDLLSWTPPTPRGSTFSPTRDGKRLNAQARRVFALMIDGKERSLGEIAEITGYPEASISARLRDIRKAKFTVDKRYVTRGLWVYRVVA